MIEVDCVQGSADWANARLGIPTASQFARILTPAKLGYSSAAVAYINELLAEWVLGCPLDAGASAYMDRGTSMEPDARKWYAFTKGVEPRTVGVCLTDDRKVGCSPDFLVGDDGGGEIKCPSAKIHVGYLLGDVAEEHRSQVQGNLWVTGREWWDVISYSPVMPCACVRAYPDPDYQHALTEALGRFCRELEAARERLIALGCQSAQERRVASREAEDADSAEWWDRTFG